MKITEVEPFLMSCPLPEPLRLPFWNGERTILKRDAMLIRVKTNLGLTGYAPGPAHERAAKEIHDLIRPFLLGRDPRQWKTFRFEEHPRVATGAPPHPGPLPLRGGEGDAARAAAGDRGGAAAHPADGSELVKTYRAVEIALMDLAARDADCPLSELVGGRQRDRIKLYGSAGMYMAPEKYAEEAAAIQAMGFPAYKMRPALGPEEDLRTVRLMREATGPGFGLMIDAHSWWRMGDRSYSLETVARLAGELAPFKPTWLEEPLPPDDHDAYRALKPRSPIPIATGEHEQTVRGFSDLIHTHAADYIQADVCCQGGFELGRQIFDACAKHKLRFAFHSWGTTLEVLAAAHLGVCWPESVVEWLEFPCYSNAGRPGMYPFPAADEILAEPLRIEQGRLVVPKAPGLGAEINERVITKYRFLPGPWSFFKIHSPPETIAVTGDHSVKWVQGKGGGEMRGEGRQT